MVILEVLIGLCWAENSPPIQNIQPIVSLWQKLNTDEGLESDKSVEVDLQVRCGQVVDTPVAL